VVDKVDRFGRTMSETVLAMKRLTDAGSALAGAGYGFGLPTSGGEDHERDKEICGGTRGGTGGNRAATLAAHLRARDAA
jgi:hypothetical protein